MAKEPVLRAAEVLGNDDQADRLVTDEPHCIGAALLWWYRRSPRQRAAGDDLLRDNL